MRRHQVLQCLQWLRRNANLRIGMLTFCLYHLIRHPEAMRKAHEEVDEILGDQQIQLTDVSKFKYIEGAHSQF